MREAPFPARLHILVPKNGGSAVVIRRGPSKQTCVLSWDTQSDEIQVSQWLNGRIYERRADISPDGKYWIYFAMNGRWNSKNRGSWTAVARAPWLKAISLFPKGDCWNGGGLFFDNRSFWLNDGCGHEEAIEAKEVKRVKAPKDLQYFGGECLTVYYNRLKRDGWERTGRSENGRWDAQVTFQKKLPGGWTLEKIAHEQIGSPKGKGCYWDEHVLVSTNRHRIEKPDWEWAERLGPDIAYCRQGRLYRAAAGNPISVSDVRMVHDFNEYIFEKLTAPY